MVRCCVCGQKWKESWQNLPVRYLQRLVNIRPAVKFCLESNWCDLRASWIWWLNSVLTDVFSHYNTEYISLSIWLKSLAISFSYPPLRTPPTPPHFLPGLPSLICFLWLRKGNWGKLCIVDIQEFIRYSEPYLSILLDARTSTHTHTHRWK